MYIALKNDIHSFLNNTETSISEVPSLFPFGASANDLIGPTGDDGTSKTIDLRVPFTFVGHEYRRILVGMINVLEFRISNMHSYCLTFLFCHCVHVISLKNCCTVTSELNFG